MINPVTMVRDKTAEPQRFQSTSLPRQRALGGFLVRRYRWGLSRWAKIALLILMLGFGVIVLFGVVPLPGGHPSGKGRCAGS